MEGCRDSLFFLEPQQTFHRQDEALRAVVVEDQPLAQVAERFGYTISTLRSMVSRVRAHRRDGITPRFSSRTDAGGRAGRLQTGTG